MPRIRLENDIPLHATPAHPSLDTLTVLCDQYREIKDRIKPLEKDAAVLRNGVDDETGHTPGIVELAKEVFRGLPRGVTGIAAPRWQLKRTVRPGSVSKAKLLELGVPLETIEKAMGKPTIVYQVDAPKDE